MFRKEERLMEYNKKMIKTREVLMRLFSFHLLEIH